MIRSEDKFKKKLLTTIKNTNEAVFQNCSFNFNTYHFFQLVQLPVLGLVKVTSRYFGLGDVILPTI